MTCRIRNILLALLCAAALFLVGTVTVFAGNLRGDANNDRVISINDVTAIQRVLAETADGDEFSEAAADVDGNGILEISDATAIQRWLAELEDAYGIGEELTDPSTATEAPTQMPTDDEGWGRTIFQP